MAAAAYSRNGRASPRRRAIALGLAIGLELLLILALIGINTGGKRLTEPRFKGRPELTFGLEPVDAPAPAAEQDRAETAERPAPTEAPPRPEPKVRLEPRPAPIQTSEVKLPILELTREELSASDIARLGRKPGEGRALAQGSGAGDSQPVGTAPDGSPLYNAEWVRKPTNQELAAYLPKMLPEGGGWGLVACRTAPRNRVEDCVELGNSPSGSRLAGAVRQAAWQFLVRPPIRGGEPLIGKWVRIRIDYRPGKEPASS